MKVTVRQGDTLWYYSQLFSLPFRLVLDSNRDLNQNQLFVGQQVNIPGYWLLTYSIRRGDTLWGIARNRGIPLDALLLLNQAVKPNALYIGQSIVIPERVTTAIVNGRQAYDYRTMMRDLGTLIEIYPFMVYESIGNSVIGKEIPEVRIGSGNKRVHLNGSFHAHEWITTPILMKTLNEYLLSLTNGTNIRGLVMSPYYEDVTLSMVPMVNPDCVDLVLHGASVAGPYENDVLSINAGVENFSNWKANIRGVDLNNQYPALWEIEARRKEQCPAPRDYPGSAPLTEPEAVAMADLTQRRNFHRVLAYHTQGKVIFWGYQGLEPPESKIIVNEFSRVSGYREVQYTDSFAGYKDWFIQEWRRPGFTVELGRGVNPLPLSQFDEMYEENLGIFLASLYL
ncbi:M14 family metallopeptidase [Anaerobacillus sp. MEB173]|uniref:M14 family metallopeptidase n=1 Tax=Anaerobacillus sp. MEB173 TaxID=3383345 RepID=UPI003F914362